MQLILLAVLFVSPVLEVMGGCSYESDNMTAYRGCVNTGHNGEECANWMQTCYWGDSQFIAEDQAAEHGNSDSTRWSKINIRSIRGVRCINTVYRRACWE